MLLGLEGHALLAVVVCAALPTAQNVFGYAVRFGQGITLGRDAGLATTLAQRARALHRGGPARLICTQHRCPARCPIGQRAMAGSRRIIGRWDGGNSW